MSYFINFLFIFIFGLAVGSFISAYTYRLPRGLNILKGRSFCPSCKNKISWFDNIPLLSFILLNGNCRYCNKKISLRYPLIELSTGLIFFLTYLSFIHCLATFKGTSLQGTVCFWREQIGFLALPYFLLVDFFLISIFITDLEHRVIPDEPSFLLLFLTFVLLILSPTNDFYLRILSGFLVSSFFLLLNFITKGRGMGLGDVKLVLFAGIFEWRLVLTWLFLSFTLGAVIGLILILFGKAKFGKQIAFGPFLVTGFFINLFLGEFIFGKLLPYLL